MEYNTLRGKLMIPEYGRNVQKMIDFATTIEDREKRNKYAQIIIRVMGQINPHLRDVADFNHKLWDHLFYISNFKLDVDSPYPKPTPETLELKPAKIQYSDKKFLYRHYGRNIELMIEKISSMEDSPQKEKLIQMVAHHLKKSYLTWNRDSVDDDLIVEHLKEMSKGQLKLDENFKFLSSNEILSKNKKTQGIQNKNGKKKNTIKKNSFQTNKRK